MRDCSLTSAQGVNLAVITPQWTKLVIRALQTVSSSRVYLLPSLHRYPTRICNVLREWTSWCRQFQSEPSSSGVFRCLWIPIVFQDTESRVSNRCVCIRSSADCEGDHDSWEFGCIHGGIVRDVRLFHYCNTQYDPRNINSSISLNIVPLSHSRCTGKVRESTRWMSNVFKFYTARRSSVGFHIFLCGVYPLDTRSDFIRDTHEDSIQFETFKDSSLFVAK